MQVNTHEELCVIPLHLFLLLAFALFQELLSLRSNHHAHRRQLRLRRSSAFQLFLHMKT